MTEGKLEKDLIAQPELWRLVLMVSDSELAVALYPPVAREEILWRRFPFDPATPSRLRAIEDIIYDNPLLLCDFKTVHCIIDSRNFTVLPPETPQEDRLTLLCETIADIDEDSVIERQPTDNAVIVQAVDREVASFLKRTFFNIVFTSKIALLASYFLTHGTANSGRRAYALVDDSRLTFLAYEDNRLLAANEFSFVKTTDAAYYVLASMNQLGFDPSNPDVSLSTHREIVDDETNIQSVLKPYVRTLHTVPFPTLRYRASRSTLQTPFPLLALPICE